MGYTVREIKEEKEMLDMNSFEMEYNAIFGGHNRCRESLSESFAIDGSHSIYSRNNSTFNFKRELSNEEKMNPANIKKVIFNRPATIVIYSDDTKMVVKCNDEDFDEEKGLAMIFMNLAFGNNRSARKRFVDKAIQDNSKEVNRK